MRIVNSCIFFCLLWNPLYSQNAQSSTNGFPPLTTNARISLITAEPGKELYTSFGHSAIRVYDPATGLDLVYNYGTFDFDAPGFYPNFLRGKLNYSLSVYDFKNAIPRLSLLILLEWFLS